MVEDCVNNGDDTTSCRESGIEDEQKTILSLRADETFQYLRGKKDCYGTYHLEQPHPDGAVGNLVRESVTGCGPMDSPVQELTADTLLLTPANCIEGCTETYIRI